VESEIYLDIETDSALQVTCVGLGFNDSTIFVLPFVTHNYQPAYDRLALLLRALAISFRDNTVVSHNGAGFDWFVMAHKYHIPIGRNVYDTMLAMHRCYPEIEKSLGHGTSLWTYETFHKDESCFNFQTPEQLTKLMRYCGKDVYTMMLIKHAIDKHAKTIPGLAASIKQVNASVRAYLTMTLQGIHFKEEYRSAIIKENDRLMTQYLRLIKILIGPIQLSTSFIYVLEITSPCI